jgi:hypothetical protein
MLEEENAEEEADDLALVGRAMCDHRFDGILFGVLSLWKI